MEVAAGSRRTSLILTAAAHNTSPSPQTVTAVTESPFGVRVLRRATGDHVAEDGWHQPEIQDFWMQFDASKQVRAYSAGALIFEQGVTSLGVYLIQQGSVLIRFAAATGGQVLAQAGPGTVLGLSECIAGARHKVNAEAACPVEIAFLERSRFLNYLREHPGTCLQIVRLLSEDLHALYHEFRFAERRSRRASLRSDDYS